ncbi:MAG: heme-binding protein [Haloarculaceae archaeon]
MVRREPPQTEEGWYAFHDLRTVDWTAWRDAPERVRERAVNEATEFLSDATALADADEGDSAVFAVLGHEADLMVVHLRPTLEDVELLERRFERTEFSRFTEQRYSYVSVTEASGYTERAREYFDGEVDDDSGLAGYIRSRLHPEIPDREFVSFYPMSKRRDPDQNWYDLPFEERAEHMASHGDIGRGYAGKVQQMITGSIGMDDWEWGVTLWADDVTHVKDLLYEMRFDPSSSKFAEFGPFFVGRRFPPADLDAYLAGERVPARQSEEPGETAGPRDEHTAGRESAESGRDGSATADETATANATGARSTGGHPGGDTGGDGDGGGRPADEGGDDGTGGRPDPSGDGAEPVEDVDRRLATFGVTPGDYDAGDYGLVCYVDGDAEDVVDDVEGLRENFDHYDTHVLTSVRADQGQAAIVSVWDNERAATTAAGFLSDVDAVTRSVRGPLERGDATADGTEGAGTADGTEGAGTADGSETESGGPPGTGNGGSADADGIRSELAEEGVYAGQPHGEDVYALVVYSRADAETLEEAVAERRGAFAAEGGHVKTAVYDTELTVGADGDADGAGDRTGNGTVGDGDDEGSGSAVTAVASLWEAADDADAAGEALMGLPGVVGRPEESDGFSTLGMFYTVKPEYREEFLDTFGTVGDSLASMDGHRETALLVNRDDPDDMFVASRWDARDDAMEFFRSEDFRDTVEWGREVLADRPRHVFLA